MFEESRHIWKPELAVGAGLPRMIWLVILAAASLQGAAPPAAEIPPQGLLHTPLDRAFGAQRSYADCLVSNAIRLGGSTGADPARVVRRARRFCREEAREMDEVHRAWQTSEGFEVRGTDRERLELIDQEAIGRLEEHRARRQPPGAEPIQPE